VLKANFNSPANTFQVATAPSPTLSGGATICAGTCAFFDHTTTYTNFSFVKSGTTQWSAGFTCLKNVDRSKIRSIVSTTVTPGTWWESF
jgi:hypothetical protein